MRHTTIFLSLVMAAFAPTASIADMDIALQPTVKNQFVSRSINGGDALEIVKGDDGYSFLVTICVDPGPAGVDINTELFQDTHRPINPNQCRALSGQSITAKNNGGVTVDLKYRIDGVFLN